MNSPEENRSFPVTKASGYRALTREYSPSDERKSCNGISAGSRHRCPGRTSELEMLIGCSRTSHSGTDVCDMLAAHDSLYWAGVQANAMRLTGIPLEQLIPAPVMTTALLHLAIARETSVRAPRLLNSAWLVDSRISARGREVIGMVGDKFPVTAGSGDSDRRYKRVWSKLQDQRSCT